MNSINYPVIKDELFILRNFGSGFSKRIVNTTKNRFFIPVNKQQYVKNTDEILEELDDTADKIVERDNQFYKGYFAARFMNNIGERNKRKNESETAPHNNLQETTAG